MTNTENSTLSAAISPDLVGEGQLSPDLVVEGQLSPDLVVEVQLSPKGPKGDSFTYQDFTQQQLEDLRIGQVNYERLTGKPQIEGVQLSGNRTFPELGLESISNEQMQKLFNGGILNG